MLNAKEPKIVNGPEILNKFVGQSEENIRKLFADAEKEVNEPYGNFELISSIKRKVTSAIFTSSFSTNLMPSRNSVARQVEAPASAIPLSTSYCPRWMEWINSTISSSSV